MWMIIIGLTTALYLITNLILLDGIALYLIQPLLWLGLALLLQKQLQSPLRFGSSRHSLIYTSALVGGLQVMTLVWTGVFTSFGQSPYLHTPLYLLINTLLFMSQIIGLEISRTSIMNLWHQHPLTLRLGVGTLLYAGFSLSFTQLLRVDLAPLPFATFLISTGLPALAESFFATYLTILGGPTASLAYRGPLAAFQWYSPLYPNPPLAIQALISVMIPVLGVLMINAAATPALLRRVGVLTTIRRRRRPAPSRSISAGWITVSVVSVIFVWASTGLLGFYPATIISGSMTPTLEVGDLAIIAPIAVETLQEGDVIQYRVNDAVVLHRIVTILPSENTFMLTTKGDANSAPDPDPVFPHQIQGKLLITISKIGWIAIYLKPLTSMLVVSVTSRPLLVGAFTILLPISLYLLHGFRTRRR